MQREDRQHPPKLRAKFKHYASRIRAIPPGGKMPRDLIADARRWIVERIAQMTSEPADDREFTLATLRKMRDYCREHGTEIAVDDPRPFVVLEAPSSIGEDLVAELRRRHDCTPKQLIEPSRSGYSTNDKPCPMLVQSHHFGADLPIGSEEADSHE